jgi:cysteine desulfurase / selenocysteine lyase
MALIAKSIKRDFPIFDRSSDGKPLVYLDSAATSQKPRAMIEALVKYYERSNANVHRSVHALAEEATELYESARERVARFIGAADPAEIVFVRNATEALNLVAEAFARPRLGPGDEIVVAVLNHHSNLVPWQQVVARTGAKLRAIPLTSGLQIDMEAAASIVGPRTRVLAITQKSNVLGTIVDVAALAQIAHRYEAAVVIDAAQSVPHMLVDVGRLDADFVALSGHKMLGPMGIGVLWGRRALLEEMPPFLTGGEMVSEVQLESASWNSLPFKFEAGTPNVGGAIGLAAAVDYLDAIGMEAISAHERALSAATWEHLERMEGVQCFQPEGGSNGIVSFRLTNVHPHDVATVLDSEGVAVRAGHHCAQPLHRALGAPATVRASYYLYNDMEDVDRLVSALQRALKFFSHYGQPGRD